MAFFNYLNANQIIYIEQKDKWGNWGGVCFLKREIPFDSKLSGCFCSNLSTW